MKKIFSSEITPYSAYMNRRKFIQSTSAFSIASSLPFTVQASHNENSTKFNDQLDGGEELNSFQEITTYNNFYEFGMGKSDPSKKSNKFQPNPWAINIEGLVKKPFTLNLEDLLSKVTIEDRIYRLRCVEAWSMVIPWQGFPLSRLIEIASPLDTAKFIQFETVYRPEEMPGQKKRILPWPYVEGLRMDEAMHPLTLLSTGLYGHELLNQNGAPLRLVVPWKYGFKSIKSIESIRFVDRQPDATWSMVAPSEYGFYSNVNNNVHHPRWTQATERRIGEFLRRPTLMYNGYEDEVSHLYKGMDLSKFY